MSDYQQVYKTRAEAFEKFFEGQRLPVSRAKFYADAKRLGMVQVDKSVRLGDLLGYVKTELKIDTVTGLSLAAKAHEEEKAALELRKLRAEVLAKEKADRKDDARWMEVVEHEMQMAAFGGALEEELRQQAALRVAELVHLCGGAPARASELHRGLEELSAAAFTEAVRARAQVVVFEDEDHAPQADPHAGH